MGALWGRMELPETMHPVLTGGHTVATSTYDGVQWAAPPARFEAGLGHYAGIAGPRPPCRTCQNSTSMTCMIMKSRSTAS